MKITWYGQSLFELIVKSKNNDEIKIIIDPFDEKLGLKVPKLDANILLVTHDHYDHANTKAVSGSPFLIDGPGEYEIKGVFIKGIPAFHDGSLGKERGRVTIFTVEAEEIKVCHLSDLGQKELSEQQQEAIGGANVLMVPVGGNYTIGPKEASTVINQIEPQIVIPMHYKIPKLKEKLEELDKFLKVMGIKNSDDLNRLSIKKKDLVEGKTQVTILKPQ